MGNLTEQFSSIARKVESGRSIQPKTGYSKPLISDTFVKECLDLYFHIIELEEFIKSIKSSYLLSDNGLNTGSKNQLTDDERDEIDIKSRIELKKYDERLKFLENYEKKRADSKQYFALFSSSQASAINKHREGILLSLNYKLRDTSKTLLQMQETRLSRKRDIELGDFGGRLSAVNVESTKFSIVPEETTTFNESLQNLTQEQLQVLQSENSEILDQKLEDLAKVEQIHRSVVEIAQLESELSAHLTVQSENINNLLNENDITEGDLIEGNKFLKSAKSKGNYATQIVMLTAFLMGVILLFFDSIKF